MGEWAWKILPFVQFDWDRNPRQMMSIVLNSMIFRRLLVFVFVSIENINQAQRSF